MSWMQYVSDTVHATVDVACLEISGSHNLPS